MPRGSLAAFEKETSMRSGTAKSALKRVEGKGEHGREGDFRELDRGRWKDVNAEGRIEWQGEEGIQFADRGVNLARRSVHTPQRQVQNKKV